LRSPADFGTFAPVPAASHSIGRASLAAFIALLVAVLPANALATTPGTPGTPQASTTVFTEGFESGLGATPVLLTSYVGASGQTYTADPAYLGYCNGAVLEFASPDSDLGASGCSTLAFYSQVRAMAYALGAHAGAAAPTTNHAVTAYTENNPGPNKVQLLEGHEARPSQVEDDPADRGRAAGRQRQPRQPGDRQRGGRRPR
jgi:hypothetical protein